MSAFPLLIGALLSLGIGAFAAASRLDRDRGFYPVVLIVIASYYGLFALMGGGSALLPELAVMTPFVALALAGFRKSLWLVVAALAAHAGLDAVHPSIIRNGATPNWWPPFCLSYDLVAGAYLALRLRSDGLSATPPAEG